MYLKFHPFKIKDLTLVFGEGYIVETLYLKVKCLFFCFV